MSKDKKKAKKPKVDERVRRLEKVAADKKRPKKERKAARAELDAIRGVFVPTEATGGDTAGPSSPPADVSAPATSPDASDAGSAEDWAEKGRAARETADRQGPLGDKQEAEVRRQWEHFRAQEAADAARRDVKVADLPPAEVAQHHEVVVEEDPYRLEAPFPAERVVVGDDGVVRFRPAATYTSSAFADEEVAKEAAQEVREVQTEHGREFAVGAPGAADRDVLEKPADPVLENGNGQPIITYLDPQTGRERTKGYTRVTTYIKGLEDTSVLEAWKQRTLLEGGAVELLQHGGTSPSLEAVARQVRRLDEALADIDRREKVEGELLGLRRAELLREHKDVLGRIGENLLTLGDAHEKANKGTDIHRLTELVDQGIALPESTSASDRRDVEAYLETKERLGLTVLWTEKRVVLDDIQVSGTMDRAYLVKLPGMSRRIRVVGDLKTGRVDWGAGKIGMQLALYARGQGYDYSKPLERERLSLNQHTGLLVHLPQGEGVCRVYAVDLELAARGLSLAREVREWRNTGKRVFDLKKPLEAPAG